MTTDAPPTVRERVASVSPLLIGVLLLWVALVMAAYYAVHKPFPSALGQAGALWGTLNEGVSIRALGNVALDLGTALWIAGIAVGVGSLLLERVLNGAAIGWLERWAFSAALGFGLVAGAFFVLGAGAGLRPIPGFFILGLLSGLSVLGLRRWPWPPWSLAALSDASEHGGALARVVQLFLLLIGALTLTRALTPPTGWDSHVYHLTAPQRYLEVGQIVGGIDIPHFYFPALVEQLYTAGLLVRGPMAAQALHLALAGLGLLALYGFLYRYQGARIAWTGVAILASAPTLWSLAGRAYVEWGLLAYGFLAFWALQNALGQGSVRWLVVSGCCAGLALGVKYTAAVLVLGLCASLLWTTLQRRRSPSPQERPPFPTWEQSGLWAAAALGVASPWYLKNLALTGNPFYPFLFGGWNWDPWRAEWFTRGGTGLLLEPWRLLTAPWELVVLASEGSLLYDVTLSPLLLAFLPLLLLLRSGPTWVRPALWVAAVGYGGWLFGAAQSELLLQGRLLLPVLPFLAALLAMALAQSERLILPSLRTPFLLDALIILVLVLNGVAMAASWVADPPLPYLAGAESRATYLERHLGPHYRALDHLNSVTPPEAQILFLWEPRSYLCQVRCQPDALLYNWRDLLRRYEEPAAIYQALRSEGYTHILLNGGGLRYFSTPPQVELDPSHLVALARFQVRYLEHVAGPTLEEVLATKTKAAASIEYTLYRLRTGG